ncbi:tRNA threonylcarbamoyladenosine dehydratase [uncultured Aquabacterium sp.]|uniref:tRNA threonylcarbamoyladenosine dehydratase n=1 Tax=Aquabacterium sp. TaxID=1872578 RepID=UPI0025D5D1C6|nr:tRNA threonylcarbamoyladenosine dehydratase [uncultured Aquabacterium sp.]
MATVSGHPDAPSDAPVEASAQPSTRSSAERLAAASRPDPERRFGGLRRLHGVAAYERLRAARIAVVGVGGVGSWTAEALARSGVAALVLIDLDHIAESNVNRQVHALETTLGQAKVEALRERFSLIHPDCSVTPIEAFVDEENVATLLDPDRLDGVIDCCDQVRAKAAIAAWGWTHGKPVVSVGAAGGKVQPHRVEVADLAEVTHDPLLASLRQRLRQRHGGPRKGRIGVTCVFSREAVAPPQDSCEVLPGGDGSLNCHGYGSSVTVTAAFGMVAAAEMLQHLITR